jgi:hypothetical protein
MSDEPKKRLRTWLGAAWVLIAVLVLYPLSVGPAGVVYSKVHNRIFRRIFWATYAPLLWAGDHCDPVAVAIIKYDRWWAERFR